MSWQQASLMCSPPLPLYNLFFSIFTITFLISFISSAVTPPSRQASVASCCIRLCWTALFKTLFRPSMAPCRTKVFSDKHWGSKAWMISQILAMYWVVWRPSAFAASWRISRSLYFLVLTTDARAFSLLTSETVWLCRDVRVLIFYSFQTSRWRGRLHNMP